MNHSRPRQTRWRRVLHWWDAWVTKREGRDASPSGRDGGLGAQSLQVAPPWHVAAQAIPVWPPPQHCGGHPMSAARPAGADMMTTEVRGRPEPFMAVDPGVLAPPVLGGTPRAARYPWYLPVEPAQSGVAADQVRLGDLEVRAASVVGPDHRCEEPATARQDAYRLGRDAKGRHLVVAVADGLSSAARSDLGATVAVRAAVDLVRRELDNVAYPGDIDMTAVFTKVAGHVAGAARQLQCSPDDVLAALITAIVPSRPTGPNGSRTVWLASLADVSAWLRQDLGWQRLAGAEKHGMDRNALDAFLPHHWNRVVVDRAEVPWGGTLAVLTDGIGDALTDVPDGARWFAERWRHPTNLASFLLDVSYEAPSQVDDRTAVVVWCGGNMRESR